MSKNNFPNLQIMLDLVFKVSLSNLPVILVLALLLKMFLVFFLPFYSGPKPIKSSNGNIFVSCLIYLYISFNFLSIMLLAPKKKKLACFI